MTVESPTIRLTYQGDGTSTAFPVPFMFYDTDDLAVFLNNAQMGAGYSVGGAGTGSGTVTITTAPATGTAVQILLDVPLTQLVKLANGTGFQAEVLNQVNDRAIQAILRLSDRADRAISAPDGDVSPDMVLPPAAIRANTGLIFDASGNLSLGSIPTVVFTQDLFNTYLGIAPIGGPQSVVETNLSVVPVSTSFGYGNPYRYGALGDGATDDFQAIRTADRVCAAMKQQLTIPNGRFVMNTTYTFTAPVLAGGGVLSGGGTAYFPAGFIAAPYPCLDCKVGALKCTEVLAEWFGATASAATPTSTGVDISTKGWNAWPSWITGATYLGAVGVGQNYGNTTFLNNNKPFSNSDTWDSIGIQLALWAACRGASGQAAGKVRLLAGNYLLSQALRYSGSMVIYPTLVGAGRLNTNLAYANPSTHPTVPCTAGNAQSLLNFYAVAFNTTVIADMSLSGPAGYYPGTRLVQLITCNMCNGIVFDDLFLNVADVGIYFDAFPLGSGSNDNEVRDCEGEYLATGIYGYDTASWAYINNLRLFPYAGYGASVGIRFAGFAFIKGGLLVNITQAVYLGTPVSQIFGSDICGLTCIGNNGRTTVINGRQITVTLTAPINASTELCSVNMGPYGFVTSRVRVGGVVQGVGGAGYISELPWTADNGTPAAGTAITAVTKYGNTTAQGLIGQAVVTSVINAPFTLKVQNTSTTAGQTYQATATITLEGSDYQLTIPA